MAFIPPKRPRNYRRYRRDQGRFRFWQTPKGNWRGQIKDGSAPSFAWKEPRGKYLDKESRWQKLSKPKKPGIKPKAAPTASPAMFAPRRKLATDEHGMQEFLNILEKTTPSGWSHESGEPIKPTPSQKRGGRGHGSIQGWRSVSSFQSTQPFNTTWFDLQNAVREAGNSTKLAKIFGKRRAAIHIQYEDSEGVLHWTSPALARNWNTTITQSEHEFEIWALMYVVRDPDDADDSPESVIHRIHILVE